MNFAKRLVISVSLTIASVAAPALADDAPKSVALRYGDLDLTRSADLGALYARIRAASRAVCAAAEGRDPAQHAEWNACRRDALDRAVASLGSDALARLHAARTTRGSSARAS